MKASAKIALLGLPALVMAGLSVAPVRAQSPATVAPIVVDTAVPIASSARSSPDRTNQLGLGKFEGYVTLSEHRADHRARKGNDMVARDVHTASQSRGNQRCRGDRLTKAATSTATKSRFITTTTTKQASLRSKANPPKLFDLRSSAMLRLPAVSGRFYPAPDPGELACAYPATHPKLTCAAEPVQRKACLVPHAGYFYSGLVAGTVYARTAIPKKILILGVRHYPQGANAAILSSGAWRTPLGDAPIDQALAEALRTACPLLEEDHVAHSSEHSLEVQIPFLQVLQREFTLFVPVALGSLRFEDLLLVGQAIGRVLADSGEEVLLLTTSDLNHYENDATTRVKDRKAIERILAMDARGLYDTCRNEAISMCGLGPTVVMLTALQSLGALRPELLCYRTSADVSGDFSAVVGYAGMTFT